MSLAPIACRAANSGRQAQSHGDQIVHGVVASSQRDLQNGGSAGSKRTVGSMRMTRASSPATCQRSRNATTACRRESSVLERLASICAANPGGELLGPPDEVLGQCAECFGAGQLAPRLLNAEVGLRDGKDRVVGRRLLLGLLCSNDLLRSQRSKESVGDGKLDVGPCADEKRLLARAEDCPADVLNLPVVPCDVCADGDIREPEQFGAVERRCRPTGHARRQIEYRARAFASCSAVGRLIGSGRSSGRTAGGIS